jgi:uncharacterized membrane protein
MIHGLGLLGGWTLAVLVFRLLLGLAVVALIVLLFIWAVRGLRHSSRMGMGYGEDPLAIAKARYARGEITEKEYKKLVSDLKD